MGRYPPHGPQPRPTSSFRAVSAAASTAAPQAANRSGITAACIQKALLQDRAIYKVRNGYQLMEDAI